MNTLQKVEAIVFYDHPTERTQRLHRAIQYRTDAAGLEELEGDLGLPSKSEGSTRLHLLSVYRLAELGLCQRGVFPEGLDQAHLPEPSGRRFFKYPKDFPVSLVLCVGDGGLIWARRGNRWIAIGCKCSLRRER